MLRLRLVKRGIFYVLVASSRLDTAVYSCNEHGKINEFGERLLKQHLTYEQNFVCFRHTLGKMRVKREMLDSTYHGNYFNPCMSRYYRRLELPDQFKTYDDDMEKEYIYESEEKYPNSCLDIASKMISRRCHFRQAVDEGTQYLRQGAYNDIPVSVRISDIS
jgi:hypothetical protein